MGKVYIVFDTGKSERSIKYFRSLFIGHFNEIGIRDNLPKNSFLIRDGQTFEPGVCDCISSSDDLEEFY
jgi:hypothetical protein